jgi:hypothetical protein
MFVPVVVLCKDNVNITESVIDEQICSNGGTTLTEANRSTRRKTFQSATLYHKSHIEDGSPRVTAFCNYGVL